MNERPFGGGRTQGFAAKSVGLKKIGLGLGGEGNGIISDTRSITIGQGKCNISLGGKGADVSESGVVFP